MDCLSNFIHAAADWLEAIGFITGIITVIKVFYINSEVKEIKEKHLFQVRVDDHLSDLKNTSKILSGLLTDFKANIKEIKLEVSNCIEHCRSLQKKLPQNTLSNISPLIRLMLKVKNNNLDISKPPTRLERFFGKQPIQQKEVDQIYTLINSLITELTHYNKDLKKAIK